MNTPNPLLRGMITGDTWKKQIKLVFGWILMILASPVFLVIDAFRPSHSRKILLAYLWFMTLIMLLTVVFFWQNVGRASELELLLGRFFHPGEEVAVTNEHLSGLINRYAAMFEINPQLISAIIQVESSNNPAARSPKGAAGLMQIMPAVWREYNPDSKCDGRHRPGAVDHGEDCIYAVEANIRTGVRHLRYLIDYFQGETGMAIEAYNAGLSNVDMERNRPRFRETRNYLQRIAAVISPTTTNRILTRLSLVLKSKALFRWMWFLSQFFWGILVFWIWKRVL